MSEPKYIRFEDAGTITAGRKNYLIINKRAGDIIGRVTWYVTWRCYVAEFAPSTVWSAGCLDDVSAFIKGLRL